MKVQKLVYVAHGFNLAFLDRPLIQEQVEAWPYGPVVKSLYNAFKRYRSDAITEEAAVFGSVPTIDSGTNSLLEQVWTKYGYRTSIELSMMTHEPGYAWDVARQGWDLALSSPTISQDLIRDEFRRRAGLNS